MYTAKIINKTQDPTSRIWSVEVEFTNGTDTFTEVVKPQDKVGFEYWVNQRLQSLNGLQELVTENNVNLVIEPSIKTPTQAEIDRNKWIEGYFQFIRLSDFAAKNILTGAKATNLNNKIANLKSTLDANAKAEYLDFI